MSRFRRRKYRPRSPMPDTMIGQRELMDLLKVDAVEFDNMLRRGDVPAPPVTKAGRLLRWNGEPAWWRGSVRQIVFDVHQIQARRSCAPSHTQATEFPLSVPRNGLLEGEAGEAAPG